MRILWVAPNGGKYKSQIIKGTGGWIAGLQDALYSFRSDIELGITFFHSFDSEKVIDGNITYLPILYNYGRSNIEKLYLRYFRKEGMYINNRLKKMAECIHLYKPDIVHIWGIENYYAGILEFIQDIPTVVHIQGLTSAYRYSYLPPCFSIKDLESSDKWLDRIIFKRGNWANYKDILNRSLNEFRLAPFVKNWIGRTEWDYNMSQMLSPKSNYFHCEELMRSDFNGTQWTYHYDDKTMYIHSSISMAMYKGVDVVLKVADILKKQNVNICWDVYGCNRRSSLLNLIAKQVSVVPEEVNVFFRGRVNGATIKNGLLSCDCFVHPSYIENSSNAIAEAQLLGVPVIAQYVGGNPSMLKNNSGVLVAPNEPYIMASAIMKMREQQVATAYSNAAMKLASERQNHEKVVSTLFEIYEQLASKKI